MRIQLFTNTHRHVEYVTHGWFSSRAPKHLCTHIHNATHHTDRFILIRHRHGYFLPKRTYLYLKTERNDRYRNPERWETFRWNHFDFHNQQQLCTLLRHHRRTVNNKYVVLRQKIRCSLATLLLSFCPYDDDYYCVDVSAFFNPFHCIDSIYTYIHGDEDICHFVNRSLLFGIAYMYWCGYMGESRTFWSSIALMATTTTITPTTNKINKRTNKSSVKKNVWNEDEGTHRIESNPNRKFIQISLGMGAHVHPSPFNRRNEIYR